MISQKTLSTTCSRSCSRHETSSSNVRSLANSSSPQSGNTVWTTSTTSARSRLSAPEKRGLPIQQALWSVYRDESHRMEHWVTLLCQANAAPVSAPSGEMAAMRKELAEMRRKLAQRGDRSRSPHIKSTPAVTLSQNTPLALEDRANPKSKGKGKGQKNVNKNGKAKAAPHSTASSVTGSRATSHASSHRVTGHTSASGVASRMSRTILAVA